MRNAYYPGMHTHDNEPQPWLRDPSTQQEMLDKISAIVAEIMNDRFGDEFVFDPIFVIPKVSYAYDDEFAYIHIYIVFDGDQAKLDPNWTGKLTGILRPPLEAIGVYDWPMTSFVLKSEWKRSAHKMLREQEQELKRASGTGQIGNGLTEHKTQRELGQNMRYVPYGAMHIHDNEPQPWLRDPSTQQEMLDKISAIVAEIMNERFGDEFVFDPIFVIPKVSYAYDDEFAYIHIYIVFDGDQSKLDPGWTSSMTRRLRPPLEAIGVYDWPMASFCAKSEWKRSERKMLREQERELKRASA